MGNLTLNGGSMAQQPGESYNEWMKRLGLGTTLASSSATPMLGNSFSPTKTTAQIAQERAKQQDIQNYGDVQQANALAGLANSAASNPAMGGVGSGILAGAGTGAAAGATIGSVVPVYGTAIGGAIGAIAGGIGGGIAGSEQEKKGKATSAQAQANFNATLALSKKQEADRNDEAVRSGNLTAQELLQKQREAALRGYRYGYTNDMFKAA